VAPLPLLLFSCLSKTPLTLVEAPLPMMRLPLKRTLPPVLSPPMKTTRPPLDWVPLLSPLLMRERLFG